MLLLGCALLLVRSPDPLLNPLMYTEDGDWVGQGLTDGWWWTAWHAKPEYLVWGNLLLLRAAVGTSQIVCADPLVCLPQAVWLWSVLFFSSIALLAYVCLRPLVPRTLAVLGWLALLLLPLGQSANEILGRGSNIGYHVVLLAVLVLHLRSRGLSTGWRAATDATIVLACATNPVVLPLVLGYGAQAAWRRRGGQLVTPADLPLTLGVAMVGLLVAVRAATSTEEQVVGALVPGHLIEVAVARAVLYPFVFPFYSSLSDVTAVVLAACWTGLVVLGLRASTGACRALLTLNGGALLLFLASTLVLRKSLTQQLGGYATTFPDRYFMGLNALVVVTTLLACAALLAVTRRTATVATVLLALWALVYVTNLGPLLENEAPLLRIRTSVTFQQQICNSSTNADKSTEVLLPIYPPGAHMEVPRDVLQDSARRLPCP